ncbi:hypothetical protein D3Y57_02050 (plasmid) [Sphingomonas paeninsulae]|uniref:EthD domain-containing protein n=1 Tax=Sphingomonas paeninsulae TaxID=2319844 RepID=A0A494TG91_SPHPE|nr:DUF4286 family protein [Sphingomonas paeninsulae]AYJ84876.1 hypothetical protein D3Y57_02050 [Sphingomonas paeninsulae]
MSDAPKDRYLFVVLTNPVEGQEEIYNDWYTNQHLPDLLRIPGFMAAQRFELTETQRLIQFPHPYRYAAIYELETDDLAATCDLMGQASAEGMMTSTPSIAHERIGSIYAPITDRVTAAGFE